MTRLVAAAVLCAGVCVPALAAPPAITGDDPPAGVVGQPYFYNFDIAPMPHTFGAQFLPPGVELNPSDFTLEGTPTEAGTFDAELFATNSSGEEARITRHITIAPAPFPDDSIPPTIEIVEMTVRHLGGGKTFEFLFRFLASDDHALEGLEYRGAVNHGPLDDWKPYPYLGPDEPFVVLLACTSFEFEVRAVDLVGNRSAAASRKFEAPPSLRKPEITSPGRARGRERRNFVHRIKAPWATRFDASGLPPGCKLDGQSGVIRGKPLRAGTFNASITASNDYGSTKRSLRIKIAPGK